MDRALGAANEPNAVSNAFVLAYRKEIPDLEIIQEADGQLPMIVEYHDLEGNLIREFIYGFFIEGDQCAYIYLTRITGKDFLPSEFLDIERLIIVEFEDETSRRIES